MDCVEWVNELTDWKTFPIVYDRPSDLVLRSRTASEELLQLLARFSGSCATRPEIRTANPHFQKLFTRKPLMSAMNEWNAGIPRDQISESSTEQSRERRSA